MSFKVDGVADPAKVDGVTHPAKVDGVSSAYSGGGNPPVNTVAPVISGDLAVGSTLTTTDGTWTNSPTSYTYQWRRGGADIGGATSSTYVTTVSDIALAVDCVVTATNDDGSANQDSNNLTPTGFVSSWDTENTSTGSTASGHVKLPLVSTGTYDFYVDWGDGSSVDHITAYNDAAVDHTYSSTGTYTVKIAGTLTGFVFNNSLDKLKLENISEWGPTFKVGTNQANYFYGCANLTITATDALNLVGTTSLAAVFRGCASLTTGNIHLWDTSGVTSLKDAFRAINFNENINALNVSAVINMNGVFFGATSFNQPLNTWNTANATDMTDMFNFSSSFNQDVSNFNVEKIAGTKLSGFLGGGGFSTTNYDLLLVALAAQNVHDSVTMGVGSTKYTGGGAVAAARDHLVTTHLWTINDGGTV